MIHVQEKAVTFKVDNQDRLAIVHEGSAKGNTGVLIVVGGPQYRIGSHRQFVQLSRYLATEDITSMRFDYQGMGDSAGDKITFDNICQEIEAAIDAFQQTSHIKKIVIWGLCDAASAALIYAHKDERVAGLVILNPWLRNDQAMGKTMVKYYYLQRLLSKDFWGKLVKGKVNVAASAKDAKGFVKDSLSAPTKDESNYQERMVKGMQAFQGKICLILSGVDVTAREFDEQTSKNKAWKKLRLKTNFIQRLPKADHTFSAGEFKRKVEEITAKFVSDL